MNFKIYVQSSSKAMAEKRGSTEIQKFECLENKKSFLGEIKSIFIVFEGLLFGEKIKI